MSNEEKEVKQKIATNPYHTVCSFAAVFVVQQLKENFVDEAKKKRKGKKKKIKQRHLNVQPIKNKRKAKALSYDIVSVNAY